MITEDNTMNLKGNSLLMKCVDEALGILSSKNIYFVVDDKFEPLINVESFDNSISFYIRLLRDYIDVDFIKKKNTSSKLNKIAIRNMYIYLNYLKKIITIKEKENIYLYTDQLIKLDIYIIFGCILHELNKRIIQMPEYFPLCIKELEKKYNIPCIDYITPFDNKWKEEAKEILETLIETKKTNIDIALLKIYEKILKSQQIEEIKKIELLQNQFKNDRFKESIQNLEEIYVSNSEYIDNFLKIKLLENGIMNDQENFKSMKDKLKSQMFYTKIFEINLENIENAINLIDFYNMNKYYNKNLNYDDDFEKYNNETNLNMKEAEKEYIDDLKNILKTKEFHEKLKAILLSYVIKNYLTAKREFINKDYGEKIIGNIGEFNDNLEAGYEYLIKCLNENIFYLNKLIIYKKLPKKIRAYVSPYMRIALNVLFIEIPDYIKKDENIKNELLTAYLIIILVYEIIYLLKYFNKNEIDTEMILSAQKQREEEKTLLNYLFGIQIINGITENQAKKINDINTWKDISDLRKIFEGNIENKIKEESEPENKNFIKFYLSDIDLDDNKIENELEDDWLDIN